MPARLSADAGLLDLRRRAANPRIRTQQGRTDDQSDHRAIRVARRLPCKSIGPCVFPSDDIADPPSNPANVRRSRDVPLSGREGKAAQDATMKMDAAGAPSGAAWKQSKATLSAGARKRVSPGRSRWRMTSCSERRCVTGSNKAEQLSASNRTGVASTRQRKSSGAAARSPIAFAEMRGNAVSRPIAGLLQRPAKTERASHGCPAGEQTPHGDVMPASAGDNHGTDRRIRS